MVVSLFLCVFTPFIHCLLSSLLQYSICQATLFPDPAGVSWHCGCCSSSAWSTFLMRQAVGSFLVPCHCKHLQVPRSREKRDTLGVRDRWQSTHV